MLLENASCIIVFRKKVLISGLVRLGNDVMYFHWTCINVNKEDNAQLISDHV